MVVSHKQQLIAALQEKVGSKLRTIAEFDEDHYDVFYAREDITPRVNHLGDDIFKDLILQGINREHLEGLFQAGKMQCSVFRFEKVTVFHFANSGVSGLFVSVDSDAEIALRKFTQICENSIREQD